MISTINIEKFDNANVSEMYINGMSIQEIADRMNVTAESIRLYLIYKDIPRRAAKRRPCLREKAPIGKTFGLWTVVSDEVKPGSEVIKGSKDRTLYWLVQCKCGTLSWKNPSHLKDGSSTRCKSCGNKNFITDNGDLNIEALILSKYNSIKQGLKTRKKTGKLEFSITPEDLSKLYNENHYCVLSGLDLSLDLNKTLQQQNLSIDRIDSNIGYTKNNIQLVDKRINMMKGTLSNDEFIQLCCKVAEHHGYKKL